MALGVPFGNYRLVRRIARGGMAEVFLAWQRSTSLSDEDAASDEEGDGFLDSTTGIRFARQVAVKRILPHLSESDEFRALFLQEARLAATLSHPNVVHIYDFGRTGDCLFLAMELIEGISLGALLRSARVQGGPAIPVEHAVRIAADALAGLHHAHTRTDAAGRPQHIVHRDVSPQNVMVTLDGVVKILDFGIAKAAWSAQETRPGVIRGKYAYMSPEQAEGQRLDGRSDVYAVGVCLYELLSGAPLVPRDLPIDAALRAVRGGAGASGLGQLELLRPDVPQELHGILRRALQQRRDHRYGSAAEMQLELERFLKGWPKMSSALLLGEYLRHHHLEPPSSAQGAAEAAESTPVMVQTGPDGSPRGPRGSRTPRTVVSEALFLPESADVPTELRLPEAPSFQATASEPTLVAAGPTVVDPRPEHRAAGDQAQTARVALPTVLSPRAALPTWRPGHAAERDPDTARTALPGMTLTRATDASLASLRAQVQPARGGVSRWFGWAGATWRALHRGPGVVALLGSLVLLLLALLWWAFS